MDRMIRWLDEKAQRPDAVIATQIAHFYEFWHRDAPIAADVLERDMTFRKINDNYVPMCGVPYHELESALHTLRSHGYEIAVCDEMTA